MWVPGGSFLCGGGWQPVHQTVLGIGGVWVVWIMWFDGRLWAISAALDGCKGGVCWGTRLRRDQKIIKKSGKLLQN